MVPSSLRRIVNNRITMQAMVGTETYIGRPGDVKISFPRGCPGLREFSKQGIFGCFAEIDEKKNEKMHLIVVLLHCCPPRGPSVAIAITVCHRSRTSEAFYDREQKKI